MNDEVFVDTSAIFALLVPEDQAHGTSKTILARLQKGGASLVSSSFVLQESVALLQARVNVAAVRRFHDAFGPLLKIVWITDELYQRAMAALLAADSRKKSLTDWSSFEIMRERGITRVFAFDKHFGEQGFQILSVPNNIALD